MRIQLIEPYYAGSHRKWAEGFAAFSRHSVDILSLPGRYWKWRMHGGAVTLAGTWLERNLQPDLIFATDMLDLTTFLAITRAHTARIPIVVYFHENQLSYPWSPDDRDILYKRDRHYGFINYATALAADGICFNSRYHRDSFFEELPRLLKNFPDYHGLENITGLREKSRVLPVGLDLSRLKKPASFRPEEKNIQPDLPLILWNHRWEYDKNPGDFFKALNILDQRGRDFQVVLLGENFSRRPEEFQKAQEKLRSKIKHSGYADSLEEYAGWLHAADLLPVTSNQDFFGISVVEAAACGCYPLLPNRLSYPELFPPESWERHFYQDFDGLVDKLAWALENMETVRNTDLSSQIRCFDWNNLICQYDDHLESIWKALV